jgi:uncharacterized tellurite resistance protein B-like protein
MLASLLKRLKGGSDDPLPPDDARTAVTALLVIAAHADDKYEDVERSQIEKALADRYGLTPAAAAALRADGEAAEAVATDMYRFTSLVKKSVPHEERTAVLEVMWRVIVADANRDSHEETLMRRITDLLGLSDRDNAEARQRAS